MPAVTNTEYAWHRRDVLVSLGTALLGEQWNISQSEGLIFSSDTGQAYPQEHFDARNTGFNPGDRSLVGIPRLRWQRSFGTEEKTSGASDAMMTTPIIRNGVVIVGETYNSQLHAYAVDSGDRVWSDGPLTMTGETLIQPAIAGDDLFFASDGISEPNDHIKESTKAIYKTPIESLQLSSVELEADPATSITIAGNHLFVGDRSGRIYKISVSDLTHQWTDIEHAGYKVAEEGNLAKSNISVAEESIVIPLRDGTIQFRERQSGELINSVTLETASPYEVAASINNGKVYLPTNRGNILVHDCRSGERRSVIDISTRVGESANMRQSLVAAPNRLIGCFDNGTDPAHLFALSYDGTIDWTYSAFDDQIVHFSAPAAMDNTLFIKSEDHLYKFNLEQGELRWREPISGRDTIPAITKRFVFLNANDTLNVFSRRHIKDDSIINRFLNLLTNPSQLAAVISILTALAWVFRRLKGDERSSNTKNEK